MSTFEKPEGISWDPASVGLPPMPTIAPGEDSMSMTIAAALPALAAPLAASVETLQAKETMFSGKVVEAQSSYQNADDSGGQWVGQLGSMLGQMSQMGQQAAGAAGGGGGGTGMFGQLMQQAMQAAQGAKGGESSQGGGGESAAGTSPAGAPAPAPQGATQPGQGSAGAPQPQQRDEA